MINYLNRRNIRKSSFFLAVKFISYLLGFTTVMVVTEWVVKEFSYDKFWKNNDRIYRVALEQYQNKDLQFRMAQNYRGVTDMLLHEFPEVEGRVRLHRDRVTVFTNDRQIQDVNMFYTDTCVFDILDRKIITSASSSLFPDLQSIVISESLSHKLFGSSNPIGKIIKLNEGWKFFVNGVFEDIPDNSHIGFDLLMTMPSLNYYISHFNNVTGKLDEAAPFVYNEPGPYDRRSWARYYGYGYILVKKGTNIDELREKAEALITQSNIPSLNPGTRLRLIFQRVTDIHLQSRMDEEFTINGSLFKVWALILVALVVMLISILNCVNLSVIGFYNKSSDAAVRLIHGAGSILLFRSLFMEELIISLSSGLFSILLSSVVLRLFNLRPVPGILSLTFILALGILSSLMTLIFPVYQIKTRSVFDLLKKRIIKNAGGKTARFVLIFIQFATSMFLISVTIVIFSQLRFLQKKDPGFMPASVIFSYSPMTMNQRPDFNEKLRTFRGKVLNIPGVIGFCTSSSIPGKDFLLHTENVTREGEEPDKKNYYQVLNVDNGYISTIGLKTVAGRNFLSGDKFAGDEVILNQLAARKLGFKDPSDAPGQPVRVDGKKYIVCGVVKDFNHLSFKEPLAPVLIFKSISWPYAVGYYSFRISGSDVKNTIGSITKAWEDTYPYEKFQSHYLKTNYMAQYEAEENFGNSVILGSFLAILISCLGLLGYARYNAEKSIREIGVRKAFGADQADIIMHFSREILYITGLSALISLPLAWLMAGSWLQNFAYRTALSVWMPLAALAITFFIAFSTTFRISLKYSRMRPHEALKTE
jgi:putative ABC transport system permease protein